MIEEAPIYPWPRIRGYQPSGKPNDLHSRGEVQRDARVGSDAIERPERLRYVAGGAAPDRRIGVPKPNCFEPRSLLEEIGRILGRAKPNQLVQARMQSRRCCRLRDGRDRLIGCRSLGGCGLWEEQDQQRDGRDEGCCKSSDRRVAAALQRGGQNGRPSPVYVHNQRAETKVAACWKSDSVLLWMTSKSGVG